MNTTINTKADKQLKKPALHQVATTHTDLRTPESMTPKLEKLIAEVEKEIELNEISAGFNNADDFLNSLNN